MVAAISLGGIGLGRALAQPSRAAAIAAQEAAEERFKILNSAVEGVLASQAQQQQTIAVLSEDIRDLKTAARQQPSGSKFATREEVARLAEALQELDRKREADKKLILGEFDRLKKDLTDILNSGSRAGAGGGSRGADPAASTSDQGVYHTIEAGNTLSVIADAYNREYNSKGLRTSVDLILKANPKIKATSLRINQKVFVPLVPN